MALTNDERSLLEGSMVDPSANEQLNLSLSNASNLDPDVHANNLSLSKKTGLPLDAVAADPKDIERREALNGINLDEHPLTAKYLSDTDNATVSFDDIETLKGLEDADLSIGRLQTAASGLYTSFAKGFTSLGKTYAVDLAESHIPTLRMMEKIDRGEELSFFNTPNSTVREYRDADPARRAEMIQEQKRKLDPTQYEAWKTVESIDKMIDGHIAANPEYKEEFITGTLPEGFGSMFSFMTVALATRGVGVKQEAPNAFITGTFASEQLKGNATEEALKNGASIEEAIEAGNLNSVMGYSEALPIARIFDRVDKYAGGGLSRKLIDSLKSGTEEAIQEFSQTLWSNMVAADILKYDPDQKLLEGTGEGAAAGFTVGAVTQFVASLFTGRRGKGGDTSFSKQLASDIEQASQTLQEQELLDQVIKLSQGSTTKERAKDRFNQFAESLGTKEIIIDPSAIEDVQGLPEEITDQIDGTGTDVSIPLTLFMSEIVNNEPLMTALRPHIRLSHGAKSLSELESDPEGIVERLVTSAVDKKETKTESDRIFKQIKDQLVSTGRQSEQTAKFSAALYPAIVNRIAKEYNIPPQDVYSRLGLRGIHGPATSESAEQSVKDTGVGKTTYTSLDELVEAKGGVVELDPNIKSESGESLLLKFDDANVRVSIRETNGSIQVSNLETVNTDDSTTPITGTKRGTETLGVIKDKADSSNKKLVLSAADKNAQSYYDTIPYLTKDSQPPIEFEGKTYTPPVTYSYTPSVSKTKTVNQDSVTFQKLPNGNLIGYKVMGLTDSGKLQAGADRRIEVDHGVGVTIDMRGNGVYMANDAQYVMDYYSGLSDNEVLLQIEFSPDDLITGSLSDVESEISVRKGKILSSVPLDEGTPKEVTATEFYESLKAAKSSTSKGAAVNLLPVEEYENMSLYLMDEGRIGFAIEHDGYLTGVFKHSDSSINGAMELIINTAISKGATKLEAFDGYLVDQYKSLGFVEVNRAPWDDQYSPDGWDKTEMKTPDVVGMELTQDGYDQAITKTNEELVFKTSGLRSGNTGVVGPDWSIRDRTGRDSIRAEEAYEGAPIIEGATGPDLNLVKVAHDYAASIGLDLKRQSEYVEVDVDRAARIAQAYDDMDHNPSDPVVAEAFDNLIRQTTAQYEALVNAGYEFFFYDENNDPYEGNPWNAMRDMRTNKRIGVFATEAGFGSGDTDIVVDDNPLVATDTGLTWLYDGQPKRVLANDLFRGVHDAFGHGLEGAGFRARGEENAWQAHAKLFTGSAVGAITSETRGQNSWLNYGTHGESNRTAKVEDTIFADQKTGLMPEWTWKEGVVGEQTDESSPVTTLKQSSDYDELHDLYVTHNLSAANVLHAYELGGIAAPSLAIVTNEAGFDDFGDISLLADSSILNDPKARTFDSDIYSPRHPQGVDIIDSKKSEQFMNRVNDVVHSTIGMGDSRFPIHNPNHANHSGVQGIENSTGAKLLWLHEQNKVPRLYNTKVPAQIKKAQGKSVESDDYHNLALAYFESQIPDDMDSEMADSIRDTFMDDDGLLSEGSLRDFTLKVNDFTRTKGKDTSRFRDDINKKLRNDKSRREYEAWALSQYNDMVKDTKIAVGYTNSGSRKYKAYTLSNIVKEMTKTIQGGENYFYGAGNIRAANANELKSIRQVQKNRHRIVSDEEFVSLKEESSKKLDDTLEKLAPYYKYDSTSFDYMSDAGSAIAEGRRAQRDAFNMTPEAEALIDELTSYLSNMPTGYFETKMQRAMSFDEFEVALVPKGTAPEVVSILRNSGLKIRVYDNNKEGKSRKDVIKTQKKLFFQEERGSLSAYSDNTRIINLTKSSDLSTFLHESAHLFLELEMQLAEEFGVTKNQTKLLKWLGVSRFEDVTTEEHEKFAESFEVYLREGKAPSLTLKRAFKEFSEWLLRIYQTLKDPRLSRAKLDNEITEFFDRMLATQEEIAEAMANPAYDEFFKSQEAAGMSDEEWDKYKSKSKERSEEAESTVLQKLIAEITKRKSQDWEEEKADLISEEMDRLSKESVHSLRKDLSNAPMDYDALKEEVGFDKISGKLIGKAKKGGVDPYEYAEVFGYGSVKEMYTELSEAPSIKKEAEDAAQARMIEKHGDILNDGSIKEEAEAAIHNDAEAELLLMEIKALGKKIKKPEINKDYLKAKAMNMISSMNFKQIKPNKFYRAEIKAAQKSVTAKTPEEAYTARIQRLANHYLYKEALEVKSRMETQRKYVNNVKKRSYKSRDVGDEYIANMKILANLYDLSKKKQTKALSDILNWYETQIEDENQLVAVSLIDEFLIKGLEAKRNGTLADLQIPTFEELTASQLNGLHSMLKHLRFVGGKMSDLAKAERTAKLEELTSWVSDQGGKDKEGRRGVPHDKTKRVALFDHMFYKIPSLLNLVRKMDGFAEFGKIRQTVYRLMEEGHERKLKIHREVYDKFEEEMGAIHDVGLSRKDSQYQDFKLESGLTLSLPSESVFMMGTYWGNESAREAIRQGFGVTDEDVMKILSSLTVEQLTLINSVWEVNESVWPALSSASVRLYGVSPPKLENTPFVVNGVEMTGGHMRLYYDSTSIELSNDQEKASSYASIMPTKNGSLNSRVGSGGKPPNLDKNSIGRALEDAVHFIAYADIGLELRTILNADMMRDTIERKHGQGFYKALIESVSSLTANRGDRESIGQIAAMFRLLRRSAVAKHLMYSVRNTVQQVGALPVATQEVGNIAFTNNLFKFATDNASFMEFVNTRSEFMNNRSSMVNREAAEYLRNISTDSKLEHIWDQFAKYGFTPQTIVDSLVAYPVWMAKYESIMNERDDETLAISAANAAVAESVGSGSDLHLGGLFHSTNTEWVKTFTLFGSWFNAYFQRVYKATGRVSRERSLETTYDAMRTLITTPFIVAVASAGLIMDGPEDDDIESWLEWAFVNYAKFMAGTLPLVRDLASMAFDGFSPKTVWSGGAEAPVNIVNAISQYSEGNRSGVKASIDIAKAVTTVIPVPSSGNFIRVAEYLESDSRGKEDDKGALLNTYQSLVEGKDK